MVQQATTAVSAASGSYKSLVRNPNVLIVLKNLEDMKSGKGSKPVLGEFIRTQPGYRDDLVRTIGEISNMPLKSQSFAMGCMSIINDCSYALHLASNTAHPILSFLNFPAEIRNQIYQDILGPSRSVHKIAIDSRCTGYFGRGWCGYKTIPDVYLHTDPLDLEIMRTCKQVYSEFVSMFFAHHIFKFLCSCNLGDFLEHECPPEGFQYLGHVDVKWNGTWGNEVFEGLLACHNLKTLLLGVDWGTKIRMSPEMFERHRFRRPDRVTYRMANGIQHLLQLSGLEHLSVQYVGFKMAPNADGIWKLRPTVETAEEVFDRESVQDFLRSRIVRPRTKEERKTSKDISRECLFNRANFNRRLVEKKATKEREATAQKAIEQEAAESKKRAEFMKSVELRVAEIKIEEEKKAAEEKATKKDDEKKRAVEEKRVAEEKRLAEQKRAAEKAAEERLTEDVKAFHSWMALNYFKSKL